MDAFADLTFYIAFPEELGRYELDVIWDFHRQSKGPLAGRHVYINPDTGKPELTKEEFDNLFAKVIEDYCDFVRSFGTYPAPVPVIIRDTDMVIEPEEPSPVTPAADTVMDPDTVSEPVSKTISEIDEEFDDPVPDWTGLDDMEDEEYEEGQHIEVAGSCYEIFAINGEKADCYVLTDKGNRRSKGGQPLTTTVTLPKTVVPAGK